MEIHSARMTELAARNGESVLVRVVLMTEEVLISDRTDQFTDRLEGPLGNKLSMLCA